MNTPYPPRRASVLRIESLKSRSHRAKSRCPSRSRKVDGCLDFARHERKESESKNALAQDFLFLGGRGGVDVGDRRVGQLLDLGFRPLAIILADCLFILVLLQIEIGRAHV